MPDVTRCPYCQCSNLRRGGFTRQRKLRIRCMGSACGKTFLLDYTNQGSRPDTPARIRELLDAGGSMRETARQLGVSTTTVSRIKRLDGERQRP